MYFWTLHWVFWSTLFIDFTFWLESVLKYTWIFSQSKKSTCEYLNLNTATPVNGHFPGELFSQFLPWIFLHSFRSQNLELAVTSWMRFVSSVKSDNSPTIYSWFLYTPTDLRCSSKMSVIRLKQLHNIHSFIIDRTCPGNRRHVVTPDMVAETRWFRSP